MPDPDFVATYTPLANDIAQQTHVDPSVVLGIISQETGDGKHVLGNNIFGISPQDASGHQYVAQYPDVQTAAQAFISTLQRPVYKDVTASDDPTAQAIALGNAGYGPNRAYGGLIAQRATAIRQQLGVDDSTPQPDADAPPPSTAKQRLQQDPALQPNTDATTAPSTDSAKSRLLADPALQPSATATKTTDTPPPATPKLRADSAFTPGDMPMVGGVLTAIKNALSQSEIHKELEPDPGAEYSQFFPAKKGAGDDSFKFGPYLPNFLRMPLLGLTSPVGELGTVDPSTGSYGVTPEAEAAINLLTGFGGKPMGSPLPSPALTAAREAPLSRDFIANPLTPEAKIAADQPPAGVTSDVATQQVTPPPAPEPTPGETQAAGAQITPATDVPEPTEAEKLRGLEYAIGQTAEERAGPGRVDNTVYVPGVQRTLAEREFLPTNALDEKIAIAEGADNGFRDAIEKLKNNNNETMSETLDNDAGDKVVLKQAYNNREAFTPQEYGAFRGEQPTDASAVMAAVDDVLNSATSKRSMVTNVFQQVRNSLLDKDGSLETMPSQLYGARQNITDMLKKGATSSSDEASNIQAAKSLLEGLLPQLDQAIANGAPRYSGYMSEFAKASQPINQMEYLQQFKASGPKSIYGASGVPQLSRVQGALKQIYKDMSAPGVNKAKSLTQAQIENMINVRNELAARDLKDRLAAVRGSDTFQQIRSKAQPSGPLMTTVKGAAGLAARGVAHAAMAGPTLGVGNALLGTYDFAIRPGIQAARAAKVARTAAEAEAARRAELLQTQPTGAAPMSAAERRLRAQLGVP